jgi:hypothetical protein
MTTSFKSEILTATHNFTNSTGNAFKIGLFKTSVTGTYGAATTAYSNVTGNSDETSGTGYTAAGIALTNVTPTTSGTTAFTSFNTPVSWTSASFSSDGAFIHNTSASGKMVSVHSFGSPQTVGSGTFTVNFPTADASNAIIRIA